MVYIINLELYKVFYHTAKEGSITKAAEQLFITQPTVSYLIKQLEELIGITLFNRKSRGVSLTEEGKILFRYVDEAMNLLNIGEKKIERLQNLQNGKVKMGISETLCKYYLIPSLASFHNNYPHIKIYLTHGTSHEIVTHLHEGNIDFGFVQLPVNDKDIRVKEAFTIQNCFVTGEKFKHLSQSTVTLQQLLDYPIITLAPNSNTSNFLYSLFEQHELSLNPDMVLGSIDLIKDFTEIGFGITLLAKNYVQEELKRNALYLINVKETIPPRSIGVISLKDTALSVAANQLIRETFVNKKF